MTERILPKDFNMKNLIQLLLTGVMLSTLASCGGGGGSISTLATSDSFDDGNLDYDSKMDILWVVDPSKSMFEEVEKVRKNIVPFIENFINLGYDYRMAVISTTAWSRYAYEANPTGLAVLADGNDIPVFSKLHKGECIDSSAANLAYNYLSADEHTDLASFLLDFEKFFDIYGIQINTSGCGLEGPPFGNYSAVTGNVFETLTPLQRGTLGSFVNDERPLQSIEAFLTSSQATGFIRNSSVNPRDNAHLAIIIISDERDASRNNLSPKDNFESHGTAVEEGYHTASYYNNFLSNYKNGASNYSIYSIVDGSLSTNIAHTAAVDSGGRSFDINASEEEYVENLSAMAQAILVSSSFFKIDNEPIQSTIQVIVTRANGVVEVVPADGFTYNSVNQGITLSAEYLPSKGDSLSITYTPRYLVSGVSDQPRLTLSQTQINERPSHAGVGPAYDPEDSAWVSDEFTKRGSILGTVSLLHGDSMGGVYSINISGSTYSDAYEINADTGEIRVQNISSGPTWYFDTETRGIHKLEVNLELPGAVEPIKRTFTISIKDLPDSRPIALADNFTVSESLADISGNIKVTGNLQYNDRDIDSSEDHVWAVDGSASVGAIVVNADGTFEYNVLKSALTDLTTESFQNVTFSYNITGETDLGGLPLASNNALVTIRINRSNSPPVNHTPIPNANVEFEGGIVNIPLAANDITVSGGSNKENLIDGTNSVFLSTAPAGEAHFIRVNFSSGLYEIHDIEIKGESGHSLGNVIFQALANGSVITREVLPVVSGDDLTVEMSTRIIGTGVSIIRPNGSVNTSGHQNLRIEDIKIWGIEAEGFSVNLSSYFSDPDGDDITYFATDINGEGPAPTWISINGNFLEGVPPTPGTWTIGVLARDTQGTTAFTTFAVTRIGSGGGVDNAAPISVLALDDAKRGGITLQRFGGRRESSPGVFIDCIGDGNQCEVANNPLADNAIRHGEGDNFIVNPYAGEAIRAALNGQNPNSLAGTQFTNVNNININVRNSLTNSGHADQIPHFGDNYGSENGWSITPVHTDPKYPLASGAFCNQSVAANGRINPCIRDMRAYGDTYTGYFVPAKTGVYRFRSSSAVDDIVRLLLAPTEYVEDLTPIITSNHTGVQGLINSVYSILGVTPVAQGEFSPNAHPAAGHITSMFYEGSVTNNQGSYRNGYVYLKQGNVYAFEIRFQEGGGSVQFSFQYDRKDITCNPTNDDPTSPGTCWDGWAAIDASVLVPSAGVDAHSVQTITAPGSSISLDVKTLFYDAEYDALEYTARLVNPNGTVYGSGNINQIGINLDAYTGFLTGALNENYSSANPKPRIIFTATEIESNNAQTSSLPIKFEVTP